MDDFNTLQFINSQVSIYCVFIIRSREYEKAILLHTQTHSLPNLFCSLRKYHISPIHFSYECEPQSLPVGWCRIAMCPHTWAAKTKLRIILHIKSAIYFHLIHSKSTLFIHFVCLITVTLFHIITHVYGNVGLPLYKQRTIAFTTQLANDSNSKYLFYLPCRYRVLYRLSRTRDVSVHLDSRVSLLTFI